MASWRLLVAVTAVVFSSSSLPLAGAQTPAWGVIPTVGNMPSSMEVPPLGCVCVDDSSPCKHFDCTCVCNLHAGQCDANCCCDPECTAEEVTSFRSHSACLPEGPVNQTLRSCVDVDLAASLVYVNPTSRMAIQGTPGADQVLCVAVDNSPLMGTYHEDPGSLSPSVLSDPGVARTYTYKGQGAGASAALPANPPAAYSVGDRLPAARMDTGVLRAAYGGLWSLPTAGADGACSYSGGGSYARYRHDSPLDQCFVTRPLSAATCEALSADRFVTSLYIGTSPRSVPTAAGGYAAVSLGSVTLVNVNTGATSIGATSDTVSTWTAGTCTCTGAVVGVSYRVRYAVATQTVTGVVVDVTVASVSQSLTECGITPISLPVSTSIAYLGDTAQATSFAASNAAKYGRSGYPGYVIGAPVLAGVLISQSGMDPTSATPTSTDKVAIARSAPSNTRLDQFSDADGNVGFDLAGLTVRGPAADGSCVSLVANTPDAATPLSVRFGEDISLSCSLKLDTTALATLCATPATLPSYIGVGVINASRPGGPVPASHIGAFGNSDPWKAWQWVGVASGSAPVSSSWDGVRQTCTGIVSGVDIEFLTVALGSTANPQYKIVASRTTYSTGVWRYAREDVRLPTSTPATNGPQTFTLRTTVTFTEYNTAAPEVLAPAPPVIPKIPSDLWYPFQTADDAASAPFVSSGAKRGGGGEEGIVLAALVAGLAVLVAAFAAGNNDVDR